MTTPLLYPVNDACRILGIGRSMLYRLIAGGRLKCVHLGKRSLITHESIEQLIADISGARGSDAAGQEPAQAATATDAAA